MKNGVRRRIDGFHAQQGDRQRAEDDAQSEDVHDTAARANGEGVGKEKVSVHTDFFLTHHLPDFDRGSADEKSTKSGATDGRDPDGCAGETRRRVQIRTDQRQVDG